MTTKTNKNLMLYHGGSELVIEPLLQHCNSAFFCTDDLSIAASFLNSSEEEGKCVSAYSLNINAEVKVIELDFEGNRWGDFDEASSYDEDDDFYGIGNFDEMAEYAIENNLCDILIANNIIDGGDISTNYAFVSQKGIDCLKFVEEVTLL